MEYCKKHINTWAYFCILFCVFVWMLVCNFCTLWVADDFWYNFSFADGSRMQSIFQIPESMIAHAQTMNGRLTAHSLVQIFTILPNIVFDVVNALMYAFLVAMLTKFSGGRNWLISLAVFAALWIYVPSFGQVMLWQDGAINYLWSGCFAVLLLYFVVNICLFDKTDRTAIQKAGLIFLSYIAGSYLESMSAAMIFCFAAMLLVRRFYLKKSIPVYVIAMFCVALVGYIGIYLAPAQWENKTSGGLNIFSMVFKVEEALGLFTHYSVLLGAFVVMTCVCVKEKVAPIYLILAAILLCGALVGHFIHIFAKGFPERGAFAAAVYLIAADAVLLGQIIKNTPMRVYAIGAAVLITLSAIRPMAYGLGDIGKAYLEMRDNESMIIQSKEQGITEVTIKALSEHSKYTAVYGLVYIDTSGPHGWPNGIMEKYYEVDSIVGQP